MISFIQEFVYNSFGLARTTDFLGLVMDIYSSSLGYEIRIKILPLGFDNKILTIDFNNVAKVNIRKQTREPLL